MKQGMHPRYMPTTVTCGTCNTVYQTRSTNKAPMKVELCANCHPFYTGEQRIIDTAGQVDRFMRRMQRRQEPPAKKTTEPVAAGNVADEE